MNRERYDALQIEGGRLVKMWTQGVPVEEAAKHQLANTAKMAIIHKHIAVMPDVHLGKGSTVGSAIPTVGAIELAIPHGLSKGHGRDKGS